MITLLVKWLVSALAVFLVGNFLPGIHVPGYKVALITALVLGVLNITVRPILKILSFPITILTLGLFSLVVNGFVLWLASRIVTGFSIDGFWWAVIGSLLISIFTALGDRIILGGDDKIGA